MEAIKNIPVRDLVYEKICDGILKGIFSPGMRLKDTELANELQISRTPVREALLKLTQAKLIENKLGRGFFVLPLDFKQASETYPILWTLEGFAVLSTNNFTELDINKLENINEQLNPNKPLNGDPLEIDAVWHKQLVMSAENSQLVDMTISLRTIVRRFEQAFLSNKERRSQSYDEHKEMIGLIRKNKSKEVVEKLEQHWKRSLVEVSKNHQTTKLF